MTTIKDCIYRFIDVPALCQQFIDTPEFQRLRRVRQLGVVHYVYPSAVHTRFEHSIGVMHLAGLAVDYICKNAGITVTSQEKELIMLAGLLHDIGHMAFSHLFDHVLENLGVTHIIAAHESRSQQVLRKINDRCQFLKDWQVERVAAMITGRGYKADAPWMYQIVNNKLCDVDVDRMDYLQRDAYHTGMPGFQPDYILQQMTIDNLGNLAFKSKARADIEHIFITRKRMFQNVYIHKTVSKIDTLYEKMIKAVVSSENGVNLSLAEFEQGSPPGSEYFDNDYSAEIFLRQQFPTVFAMIDCRDINTAAILLEITVNKPSGKKAKFGSSSDNLQEIMSRVRFV